MITSTNSPNTTHQAQIYVYSPDKQDSPQSARSALLHGRLQPLFCT